MIGLGSDKNCSSLVFKLQIFIGEGVENTHFECEFLLKKDGRMGLIQSDQILNQSNLTIILFPPPPEQHIANGKIYQKKGFLYEWVVECVKYTNS